MSSSKVWCQMVTFMSPALLPSYGLSPDDLVEHGRRYQRAIGPLIQTGGVLEYLP